MENPMPEPEDSSEKPGKAAQSREDGQPGKKQPRKRSSRRRKSRGGRSTARLSFPKHAISKCLRIPQAILDQNAGNQCTDKEAAKFAGMVYTGPVGVEISSAIKYGLLERPAPGTVKPT